MHGFLSQKRFSLSLSLSQFFNEFFIHSSIYAKLLIFGNHFSFFFFLFLFLIIVFNIYFFNIYTSSTFLSPLPFHLPTTSSFFLPPLPFHLPTTLYINIILPLSFRLPLFCLFLFTPFYYKFVTISSILCIIYSHKKGSLSLSLSLSLSRFFGGFFSFSCISTLG